MRRALLASLVLVAVSCEAGCVTIATTDLFKPLATDRVSISPLSVHVDRDRVVVTAGVSRTSIDGRGDFEMREFDEDHRDGVRVSQTERARRPSGSPCVVYRREDGEEKPGWPAVRDAVTLVDDTGYIGGSRVPFTTDLRDRRAVVAIDGDPDSFSVRVRLPDGRALGLRPRAPSRRLGAAAVRTAIYVLVLPVALAIDIALSPFELIGLHISRSSC